MEEGKKILLSSFWSAKGWTKSEISDEDFELCKRQGYMFDDPVYIEHDEYLVKLKEILDQIDPHDVANAFLYSLSARELEYRSAMGSYWYAVAIPSHSFDYAKNNYTCPVCAWNAWHTWDTGRHGGLNVLNFERCKFGGVRHTYGEYALFDLEQFLLLPKVVPTDEDIRIFNRILACVSEIDPSKKVGELHKVITSKKIFKTNRNELQVLLDILGICGVLSSANNPCYVDRFTNYDGSRDPIESKNDYAYPVNRWHASDGINRNRLSVVFEGFDIMTT